MLVYEICGFCSCCIVGTFSKTLPLCPSLLLFCSPHASKTKAKMPIMMNVFLQINIHYHCLQ